MKINMLSENYQRLESALSNLYNGELPLYSYVDDLSKSLYKSGKNYFILPPRKSIDHKTHYFYFTKEIYNREEVYEFSHVD